MGKWFKRSSDSNLSGAYALNALNAEERAAFERQMSKSETLRAEATEFGDTAAMLSDGIDEVQPPDYLRTRIMAQIENTPQLTAAEATNDVFSPNVSPMVQAHRSRRTAITGFATAFAFLAIAGGGYSIYNAQATSVVQQASGIDQIRAADDSQNVTLATARGKVNIIWSNTTAKAAILNNDKLKLPANSTYQLWVTDKTGKTVSAGLLSANDSVWTTFTQSIKHGDTLRMTVEPKGGSKQPTSTPLFRLAV